MASKSTEIDWDEVLLTQDPKKKEIEVSFKRVDGGGFFGDGGPEPGTPPGVTEDPQGCTNTVRVVSDDTFVYQDNEPHWIWLVLRSMPSEYMEVDLQFTDGSMVYPEYTTQTLTWPINPGNFESDNTGFIGKKVPLILGTVNPANTTGNYFVTITGVRGFSEGDNTPCFDANPVSIDFDATASVVDPEDAPEGGPIPGDNPECGTGTDCNLAPVWLAENGYQFHLDGTDYDPAVLNPAWVWNGNTANSGTGTQNLFEVTGANGTPTGWLTYDPSAADRDFPVLGSDEIQYLTDNFCEIPSKLPSFPTPLILSENPSQNRPVGDPGPSPILLGTEIEGDLTQGYFVMLLKTNSISSGDDFRVTLNTSTGIVSFTSAGAQLGSTVTSAQLSMTLIFKADGTVFQGLTQVGTWLTNPQTGTQFYQVLFRFTIQHDYTTVRANPDSGSTGVWAKELAGKVELQWARAREQDTNLPFGLWNTPNNGTTGAGNIGWGGPGGFWGLLDANPHVTGANTVRFTSGGITGKLLALGNSDDFLNRWKRKDLNYTAPDYCNRIP